MLRCSGYTIWLPRSSGIFLGQVWSGLRGDLPGQMDVFLQLTISGLATGMVYALEAVGFVIPVP